MATVKITINTGNAAFEDDLGEVARILTDLAARFTDGVDEGPVLDVNGNTVGRVTVYFGRPRQAVR